MFRPVGIAPTVYTSRVQFGEEKEKTPVQRVQEMMKNNGLKDARDIALLSTDQWLGDQVAEDLKKHEELLAGVEKQKAKDSFDAKI